MDLRVLAAEATSVEMNYDFIDLVDFPQPFEDTLFEIVFDGLVVQESHFDLLAWIELRGALVEANKLRTDFLLIVFDLLELFVGEIIIRPCLLYIVDLG